MTKPCEDRDARADRRQRILSGSVTAPVRRGFRWDVWDIGPRLRRLTEQRAKLEIYRSERGPSAFDQLTPFRRALGMSAHAVTGHLRAKQRSGRYAPIPVAKEVLNRPKSSRSFMLLGDAQCLANQRAERSIMSSVQHIARYFAVDNFPRRVRRTVARNSMKPRMIAIITSAMML